MTDDLCGICKRPLDDPSDPTTKSCGGDCLKCMAEVAGDPDCIVSMQNIRIEALTAENERLRATVGDRMEFYLDRIEALTAENERLREALTTAKNALNLLSHGEGDDYRMEWLEAVLAETRAALGEKQ